MSYTKEELEKLEATLHRTSGQQGAVDDQPTEKGEPDPELVKRLHELTAQLEDLQNPESLRVRIAYLKEESARLRDRCETREREIAEFSRAAHDWKLLAEEYRGHEAEIPADKRYCDDCGRATVWSNSGDCPRLVCPNCATRSES